MLLKKMIIFLSVSLIVTIILLAIVIFLEKKGIVFFKKDEATLLANAAEERERQRKLNEQRDLENYERIKQSLLKELEIKKKEEQRQSEINELRRRQKEKEKENSNDTKMNNLNELGKIIKDIFNILENNKLVLNEFDRNISMFFQKRDLSIDRYLIQCEKNLPYNKYLYLNLLDCLLDYIYSPNRARSYNNAYDEIYVKAQQKALESTKEVLAFLNGKNIDDMTKDFHHLRQLKASGKFQELFEEFETQIISYKACFETIKAVIQVLISSSNKCDFIASNCSRNTVRNQIDAYVKLFIKGMYQESNYLKGKNF